MPLKLGFWGFDPINGRGNTGPQRAPPCAETHHMTYIDRQNLYMVDGTRDPKNKKGLLRKPIHVTCHVFAETTHVVAAPHAFARVVIPAT